MRVKMRSNKLLRMVSVVVSSVLVSSCQTASVMTGEAKKMLHADPLKYNGKYLNESESIGLYSLTGEDARNALGVLQVDSNQKCIEFLSRLVLARGGTNFINETSSTFLSAAASVTTPLSVARGLAAGSTVISGSKTAFNSEFFDNANTAALLQIVQQTYSKDINIFAVSLRETPDSDLKFSNEIGRLVRAHSNCSLESARATQQATVQAAAASSPSSAQSSAATVFAASQAASAAAAAASAADAAASAAAKSGGSVSAATAASAASQAAATAATAAKAATAAANAASAASEKYIGRAILPGAALQDR